MYHQQTLFLGLLRKHYHLLFKMFVLMIQSEADLDLPMVFSSTYVRTYVLTVNSSTRVRRISACDSDSNRNQPTRLAGHFRGTNMLASTSQWREVHC